MSSHVNKTTDSETSFARRGLTPLTYHDVLESLANTSGFPGISASPYKLTRDLFESHLVAFSSHDAPVGLLSDIGFKSGVLLTFDDGGKSAVTCIAPMLEKFGWKGHFFVTAKFIDTPGFLTRSDIRDLRHRGHCIGSHSYSHPLLFGNLPLNEISEEWSKSVEVLSEILNERITTASVPGGTYTRNVALAASSAGLKVLFTSKPTAKRQKVGECLVLGRYSMHSSSSATHVLGIVQGNSLRRWREILFWQIKEFAKTVGGAYYFTLKKVLLSRRRG